MHLTRHTDYSLRLLMVLAAEPERLHTIEEVAARHRVSRSHLMKVALRLARAGYVRSLRGRGGGLQLGRPADQLRLGDIVRSTEEDFGIAECFDHDGNTCLIAGACRLRGILREAVQAFLATLDRYTLADLVDSPRLVRHMQRLLQR